MAKESRTHKKNFFIPHHKVPKIKVKDVTYARFAYTIREMKKDKHRTRITVGGGKSNTMVM